MTRRLKVPVFKVADLPREAIGAFRNLDDADYDYRRAYGDRPPATRMDIAPQGWARVRYFTDKVFQRSNSI
jgi:hypothetical protein